MVNMGTMGLDVMAGEGWSGDEEVVVMLLWTQYDHGYRAMKEM
jgi:hypothetical protein